MHTKDSSSNQIRLARLVIRKFWSVFFLNTAGGIQPQLATVARNGAHDGSPCTWFDPNHKHRRQRSSFFCLPGSNLRTWGQGHCVYRKPWAGPFGVWGVVHDRISPEGLKESSSVRHFAGVRGRFDCSSPGRLRVPCQQHNTDAINEAPKPDTHSPALNAVEGVRGPVCLVSGRVLPGSRAGRAGYAAGEMCLPISLGAINNIPAMNSQRGGGNRAAAGQRVLPDTGTGRAGQQRHFSCAQRKFLGGRLVGDLGRRFPGVQVLSNEFGPAVVITQGIFSAGGFRKTVSPLSWFDGFLPTRSTLGSGGRCLFFFPQNKQLWLKRTPVIVGPLKGWERRPVGHTGGIFGTVSYSLCPRLWVLPLIAFWSVFHARNNFFAHNRQLLESNSNSKQAPAFGSFVGGLECFAIPDHAPRRHSKQTSGNVGVGARIVFRSRTGAEKVGADDAPEPPFSRVRFSTKSPRFETGVASFCTQPNGFVQRVN
jgi:hypothetical protein